MKSYCLYLRFLYVLALSAIVPSAFAAPITIPFALIRDSAASLPVGSAVPIEQRLAALLRSQFDALGLDVQNGLVISNFPVEAYQQDLVSVCAVPLPKEIQTDATTAHVRIDDSSAVVLDLDDIHNMSVSITLIGEVHAQTKARVIWGQAVPFVSNCKRISTDNGTLEVTQPLTLTLKLSVALAPSYDSAQVAMVLDKHANLSGSVQFGKGNIKPDFGSISLTEALINAFEDYLLRALRNSTNDRFAQRVQQVNWQLDGLDAAGNPDPAITRFNAPSVFELLQGPADDALTKLITVDLRLPSRIVDVLNQRGGELLLQLAVRDDAERGALLESLAAELGCDALTERFALPLPLAPLYAQNAATCIAVDPRGPAQTRYFADAACSKEVAYQPTADAEQCQARLSKTAEKTLGNAASWQPDAPQVNDPLPDTPSRRWTSLLTNRLSIGAISLEGLHQPYVKQLRYKRIETPRPGTGACELEMRVYKKDLATEAGLKPLLAIHGGTWKGRGLSVLGLEASIAHFTEQDFVVFAPFYRLVGAESGNDECNRATWREVTADIEDALQWVGDHGVAFGADAGPVNVFGQSAGGHLAAWLGTHRSDSVRRALLFYPPLDVLDFLKGAIPAGGPYADFRGFGLRALAQLFGARPSAADVRLDRLSLMSVDALQPGDDLTAHVPDEVFDLTQVAMNDPPLYLHRCATAAQVDLATIDPALPPAELLTCLKQDLSAFLLQNSFFHQARQRRGSYNLVQGTADNLVPYPQAISLCNALDGGDRPSQIIGDHATLHCGGVSQAELITGAGHALDVGLCIDTVCPPGPPGTPTRLGVEQALRSAYAWLGAPDPAPAPTPVADPGAVAQIDPEPATAIAPLPTRRAPPTHAEPSQQNVTGGNGGGGLNVALLALLGAAMLGRGRRSQRPRKNNLSN